MTKEKLDVYEEMKKDAIKVLDGLKPELAPFVYVDDPRTGGVLQYSFGAPEVKAISREKVEKMGIGDTKQINAEWLNLCAGLDKGHIGAMTAGFTKGWNKPEANPANYDRNTGKYNAPSRTEMLAQRRKFAKSGLERC